MFPIKWTFFLFSKLCAVFFQFCLFFFVSIVRVWITRATLSPIHWIHSNNADMKLTGNRWNWVTLKRVPGFSKQPSCQSIHSLYILKGVISNGSEKMTNPITLLVFFFLQFSSLQRLHIFKILSIIIPPIFSTKIQLFAPRNMRHLRSPKCAISSQ